MRLAVIIPTKGRAALVCRTIERLRHQRRLPDAVFVSAPDETHVDQLATSQFPVYYCFGQQGASAQRNNALGAVVHDFDIATFFDDDFLAADDYLLNVERSFKERSDLRVVTGHVLRDGINDAGVSFEEAEAILAAVSPLAYENGSVKDWHAGYGCNMSMRTSCIGSERFDERLVLNSWLEDVDFTRRIARGGRIVRHTALRGVHMGTKAGRVSGVRFGYSQVINPLYLVRKGSYPASYAAYLISRNLFANMGRLLWPEPWIDRRGRLRGNLIAAMHLLAGRLEPERALEL